MRLIGVLACWGIFQRVALTIVRRAASPGMAASRSSCTRPTFPLLAAVKIWLWHLVPVENQFWMLTHYAVSVTGDGLHRRSYRALRSPAGAEAVRLPERGSGLAAS